MNLSTKYLGIELKNPIIVGASNLATDIKTLKKLEEAGAGAIVYKSLFEEQIHLENLQFNQTIDGSKERHAEMASGFGHNVEVGPEEFLLNFSDAKKAVNIPLIASLNAIYDDTWEEYAKKLEDAGADALELNFYNNPKDPELEGRAILFSELDTIEQVKASVNIPVSVKLSSFYTNPLYTFNEMDKKGIDGLILFNRLFHADININTEELTSNYNLSAENDSRLSLRYVGLLYDNINANICASRGIFTADDVIKMILAGADVVQVVSTIYRNGPQQITKMLEDMEVWMAEKKYKSLDDFRGNLSKKNVKDPYAYRRAQYVDILLNPAKIIKDYPI
ncbi:MAG: dihydroorotate dehydrogenase-like protein [Lentimicrobiaceae bacterium]|jgi:dihydroorotate dehydrogenase (fumarate)|nr:dihydroorotate dehydrogenase-like protein [Lentimicrobiaceae bacterium]MCP4910257.1 dihydroorotate dehydrogenase-like protein [Bacteroidota bacterium]MBT3455424.1 dihydroorotate dehydrogenase-like protein [Lentimicrobiaceae bacterium]MBT3818739.1 dihydroorotate dehydrogenase-like protein [Lentimicrobiaceae bacterium]MBT4062335.1 dihydroorotate dehydrogenase-like protein [Lentimicrobiaceae bacterium]